MGAVDLLRQLLEPNPDVRLTADAALKHEWLLSSLKASELRRLRAGSYVKVLGKRQGSRWIQGGIQCDRIAMHVVLKAWWNEWRAVIILFGGVGFSAGLAALVLRGKKVGKICAF